jgi:DNA-binding HxlR family transcriptional regulator
METNVIPPWNIYNEHCPTRLVLDRISDKWTVLIIGRLSTGTKRYSELKREIGGVSKKVLAQTLKEMERDGLIIRRVYATVPPKTEYSLTPLGNTLISLIQQIRTWSETNIQAVLKSHTHYDEKMKDVTPET